MDSILRICKKCKEEKKLGEFSKASNCKLGYRHECKECRRKRYVKKGPCKDNLGWFKKGHKYLPGSEKGWFKKGERRSPDTEFKKGQTPHNFIDGKSDERYKHLTTKKWAKLRLKILERDKYRCRRCNCRSDILHVHHIIPIRIDPSKLYDEENLLTACPKCHAILDQKYKD